MAEKYSEEKAREFFDSLAKHIRANLKDKSAIIEHIQKTGKREPEGIFVKEWLAKSFESFPEAKNLENCEIRVEGYDKGKPLQLTYNIFGQHPCPDFAIISDQICVCGEAKYSTGITVLMGAIGETVFRLESSRHQSLPILKNNGNCKTFDYGLIVFFSRKNKKGVELAQFVKKQEEKLMDELWKKYGIYTIII